MSSDERVVIGSYAVNNLFVYNVVKYDWAGFMNQISTGMALGGIAGAASKIDQLKHEDLTAEFSSSVSEVLKNFDMQQRFADIIKEEVKPESPAQILYLAGDEYKSFKFENKDIVISVGLSFTFSGKKPVLKTMANTSITSKGIDYSQLQNLTDSITVLSKDVEVLPPGKITNVTKFGKMSKLLHLSRELTSYLSCMQRFTFKSEAYPVEKWLENDGQLIKSELERLMREFATTFNNLLKG
jgi:hypothetical protein